MTNFVEAIRFSILFKADLQNHTISREILEIFQSSSIKVRPIKYGVYQMEKKLEGNLLAALDVLTNNTEKTKGLRTGGITLGINSLCEYSIRWNKSDSPNFSSISGFLGLSEIQSKIDDFLELMKSLITAVDPVYADVKSMMIKNWDAPLDLHLRLPDIPPISVYGKEYIDLFGEEKILTSPCKKIEKIGNCYWLETGETVTEEVPTEKRKEI